MKLKIEKGHISIISPNLTSFCGLFSGTSKTSRGAALFPFIIFRSKEEKVPWLINHELIHFRQQIEMLFVGLLVLSMLETLYAVLVLKKTFLDAYKWRSAEQEAYRNQQNPNYLKSRKFLKIFYYTMNKKNFSFGSPGEIIIH